MNIKVHTFHHEFFHNSNIQLGINPTYLIGIKGKDKPIYVPTANLNEINEKYNEGYSFYIHINSPKYNGSKKYNDNEIDTIKNIAFDFDCSKNPTRAIKAAQLVAKELSKAGLLPKDVRIDNSGGGAHLFIFIPEIKCTNTIILAVKVVYKKYLCIIRELLQEHGYDDVIVDNIGDPSRILSVPGLNRVPNKHPYDHRSLKNGYTITTIQGSKERNEFKPFYNMILEAEKEISNNKLVDKVVNKKRYVASVKKHDFITEMLRDIFEYEVNIAIKNNTYKFDGNVSRHFCIICDTMFKNRWLKYGEKEGITFVIENADIIDKCIGNKYGDDCYRIAKHLSTTFEDPNTYDPKKSKKEEIEKRENDLLDSILSNVKVKMPHKQIYKPPIELKKQFDAFVENCVSEDDGAFISTDDLYNLFIEYTHADVCKNTFSKMFKQSGFTYKQKSVNNKKLKGYHNIKVVVPRARVVKKRTRNTQKTYIKKARKLFKNVLTYDIIVARVRGPPI